MLKKNDIVTLTITDLTPEGMGVGKASDGYVLFIPKTAVGDVISAKIVKMLASYGYARCEKIVTPSPARCKTDCEVFSKCGGCLLRHIRYDEELLLKKSWVDAHFTRIGKLPVSCDAIIPSPQICGYRNKAQLPCGADPDGRVAFGFFAPHSHRIIPSPECRLHPEFYTDITRTVADWMKRFSISPYDETTHCELIRHLFIRDGRISGEVMVCLIANANTLPHTKELIDALLSRNSKIKSIILNTNAKPGNSILGKTCTTLYGKEAITDTLCGLTFDISPLSFYQVNHDGAEVLYGVAQEFAALTGKETLLDLYCGVGTIGLSMAKDASRLIGVEVIPAAVENARRNAEKNGITNAEFICADAGEAAEQLASDGIYPDVVVVDPPRGGCDGQVLDAILQMVPERIVMVSCNSATAARDCAYLAEHGYAVSKLRAVDMFPRTGHVECVVLMSRV